MNAQMFPSKTFAQMNAIPWQEQEEFLNSISDMCTTYKEYYQAKDVDKMKKGIRRFLKATSPDGRVVDFEIAPTRRSPRKIAEAAAAGPSSAETTTEVEVKAEQHEITKAATKRKLDSLFK